MKFSDLKVSGRQLVFISINSGYGGAEKYFDGLYADYCHANPSSAADYLRYDLKSGYFGLLKQLTRFRRKTVIYNMSVLGIGLGGALLLKCLGNRLVLYPHVVVSHYILGSRLPFLRNIFRRIALKISAAVVMISDGNCFELGSLLARKNHCFVYNYVTCENDEPISKLSLNMGIAVIGRLHDKHKRQLELIDVVGSFCKQHSITLHFFGNGPDEAALKEKVRILGLKDYVIFHGWLAEEKIFDQEFCCVINNSGWEGMPLSLLEAIYHDKLVLARDVNGNRELLYNDFLYKSANELPNLLTRFILKKEISPALLDSQKQFVFQKFKRINALKSLAQCVARFTGNSSPSKLLK